MMGTGSGRWVKHLVGLRPVERQLGVKELHDEHPDEHLGFPTQFTAASVYR